MYIILFNAEKQKNTATRKYIIKCCGRKTCNVDRSRVEGRNISTVDPLKNAKRVTGGLGKSPVTKIAGKTLSGGKTKTTK